MTLIDGDRIITAQLYDDEHEEFTEKRMSIIEYINAYTDEGVTVADIKALEQEPCEDCISRQIISDYVEIHIQEINTGYGDLNKHTNEILRMIVDYIGSMPPVTPQSKTGRWIDDKCSVCGKGIEDLIESSEWYRNESPKYCPFCGIKIQPYKAESEEK